MSILIINMSFEIYSFMRKHTFAVIKVQQNKFNPWEYKLIVKPAVEN